MAATLAGCAGANSRYPSLALRDFERQPVAAAGAAPIAAPLPAPPAVESARVAAIRDAAETAFIGFTREQASTAALVGRARGQSTESDARSRALVALADLASRRSATFVHLGDLDLLAAESALAFGANGEIETARSDVLAMVEQQDKVLAALWSEMGQ